MQGMARKKARFAIGSIELKDVKGEGGQMWSDFQTMDCDGLPRHLRQQLDDSVARGLDCSMDLRGPSKRPWIRAVWENLRKLIMIRDNRRGVWSHIRMLQRRLLRQLR